MKILIKVFYVQRTNFLQTLDKIKIIKWHYLICYQLEHLIQYGCRNYYTKPQEVEPKFF